MQETKLLDRRIFERIPVNLTLKFLYPNSDTEGLAQTQDISAAGIGLVTDRELLPRTPLEMWLQMPDKGEPLHTTGEVVWSKMIEPNKYRVGISLEKAELIGMSRVLRTTYCYNS
jgi:hypothetical protein